MTLKPPTCRTCGKTEYGHLCKGALNIKEIEAKARSAGTKRSKKKVKANAETD